MLLTCFDFLESCVPQAGIPGPRKLLKFISRDSQCTWSIYSKCTNLPQTPGVEKDYLHFAWNKLNEGNKLMRKSLFRVVCLWRFIAEWNKLIWEIKINPWAGLWAQGSRATFQQIILNSSTILVPVAAGGGSCLVMSLQPGMSSRLWLQQQKFVSF